jgi:hypothetical protein
MLHALGLKYSKKKWIILIHVDLYGRETSNLNLYFDPLAEKPGGKRHWL